MYRNILLPVDLNDESSWRAACPTAVACCQAFGATLHVATVVPDYGMTVVAQFFPEDYEQQAQAKADQELAAFIDAHVPQGVACERTIGYGPVYEELLRMAKAAACDLIVLAARRPELKDYLLGPNAARVVRHAVCSVLVVRE